MNYYHFEKWKAFVAAQKGIILKTEEKEGKIICTVQCSQGHQWTVKSYYECRGCYHYCKECNYLRLGYKRHHLIKKEYLSQNPINASKACKIIVCEPSIQYFMKIKAKIEGLNPQIEQEIIQWIKNINKRALKKNVIYSFKIPAPLAFFLYCKKNDYKISYDEIHSIFGINQTTLRKRLKQLLTPIELQKLQDSYI